METPVGIHLEVLEIQRWIWPHAGIVDGGFSRTYAGIIAGFPAFQCWISKDDGWIRTMEFQDLSQIPHIKFANLRAILCWKSRMPELKLRESRHE